MLFKTYFIEARVAAVVWMGATFRSAFRCVPFPGIAVCRVRAFFRTVCRNYEASGPVMMSAACWLAAIWPGWMEGLA